MDIKKLLLIRSILIGSAAFMVTLIVAFFLTWTFPAILIALGVGALGFVWFWNRGFASFPKIGEEKRAAFGADYNVDAFDLGKDPQKSWEHLPTVADAHKFAFSTFVSMLLTLHRKNQLELVGMLKDFFFPLLNQVENKYRHFAGYYSQRRLIEFLMYRLPALKHAIEGVDGELTTWEQVKDLFLTAYNTELVFHYDEVTHQRLVNAYAGIIETGGSVADTREILDVSPTSLTESEKRNFAQQSRAIEKLMIQMLAGGSDDMLTAYNQIGIGVNDVIILENHPLLITATSFLRSKKEIDENDPLGIKRYFLKAFNLVEQKYCLFRTHYYQGTLKIYLGEEIDSLEVINITDGTPLDSEKELHSITEVDGSIRFKGLTFEFDGRRPVARFFSWDAEKGDPVAWCTFTNDANQRIDILVEAGALKAQYYQEFPADGTFFHFFNISSTSKK